MPAQQWGPPLPAPAPSQPSATGIVLLVIGIVATVGGALFLLGAVVNANHHNVLRQRGVPTEGQILGNSLIPGQRHIAYSTPEGRYERLMTVPMGTVINPDRTIEVVYDPSHPNVAETAVYLARTKRQDPILLVIAFVVTVAAVCAIVFGSVLIRRAKRRPARALA